MFTVPRRNPTKLKTITLRITRTPMPYPRSHLTPVLLLSGSPLPIALTSFTRSRPFPRALDFHAQESRELRVRGPVSRTSRASHTRSRPSCASRGGARAHCPVFALHFQSTCVLYLLISHPYSLKFSDRSLPSPLLCYLRYILPTFMWA